VTNYELQEKGRKNLIRIPAFKLLLLLLLLLRPKFKITNFKIAAMDGRSGARRQASIAPGWTRRITPSSRTD
jgi:hypothetical protein